MKVGTRIKNIRESKGITRTELAEKIGVTDVSISRYENNKREPNLDTIKKIADALEVQINELIIDYINISISQFIDTKSTFKQEEIEYQNYLNLYYKTLESIKNTENSINIKKKITDIGLNNFKDVLKYEDLKINIKSLYLYYALSNFLDNPDKLELKDQLESMLNMFEVPKDKELKITLVDKEKI